MEKQNGSLSQQEKAISLFEFIKELNKLKQKVVLHRKEYPFCQSLSELPEDEENISVFYRDRVEEESGEEGSGSVLLSVRKPRFEPCPEPPFLLERWLLDGNVSDVSAINADRSPNYIVETGYKIYQCRLS